MPTSVARLGRERSLSTLAKRLFVIEPPHEGAKLRNAERALVRANPALARPEGFVSGRTVVVPANIGLATTERVSGRGDDLAGLLGEAGLRLEVAGQQLDAQFDSAAQRDANTLEMLKARDLRRQLRAALPDSEKLLVQTEKTLKARGDAAEKQRGRFANGILNALSEIDRLKRQAE